MNPYDEQGLRDEVIYLHALWHQGPPRNPNPISGSMPKPKPKPKLEHPSASLHIPANTTPFKKQQNSTNGKRKKKKKKSSEQQGSSNNASGSEPGGDSGPQWPVKPTTSPSHTTGWPELKPKPQTRPQLVSAQEQAKFLAMQVQKKGLASCIEFFSKRVNEETDEDDEEIGREEYLIENDKLMDAEAYKFLLQMFVNDSKLRGYYEKNYENGEFCCLVCVGIGKKVHKRYIDCLGLVQHSISISKTKRKRAHRAFGQVVCRVLGWDINRLPVIVLKGEPLGKSLAKTGVSRDEMPGGNGENNTDDITIAEDNGSAKSGKNSEVMEKKVADVCENDSKLMICESSLKVDDINKHLKNPDGEFLNMEADKGVTIDCQVSSPSLVACSGWSCTMSVDDNPTLASGWPDWKPQRPLNIYLASTEEQTQLSAVQLQQKVLEACQEFFGKGACSTDDESDDKDEDDLMDEDISEDNEELKFFLKVFTENSELRSYYEKNYGGGEFRCLVCGAIGKKVWKLFKDCLGLLQHSTAILKTKKKRAHRAFGQVICKVLGWDIDHLPVIVLKGKPLGHCLAELGASQVEADRNADGNKDDFTAAMNDADCQLAQKDDADLHSNNGTLIANEISPNEDGTDTHVNKVHNGSSDMEGKKEGVPDTLVM